MKILYLEDHEFFASEVIEYLEEKGHEVYYATNYMQAQSLTKKGAPFDCSLLDVILQNGKTGILFAEKYQNDLGRIMFITGTTDKTTINAMSRYSSASKLYTIYDKIDEFLQGGDPKIERVGSNSGGYIVGN